MIFRPGHDKRSGRFTESCFAPGGTDPSGRPCEAPAGSSCRTRGGKVAPKYHTPRFMLVPQLRTPVDRGPGLDGGPGA
ncbi:zinc finger domain-containing protein [Streptosporangium sp. CA-135522]|uniref:zinc finger domain-containing protein n=1 Tax=Streptosporangium sp. CA-135522 TaxID=3240072 RepID=UPI003D91337F